MTTSRMDASPFVSYLVESTVADKLHDNIQSYSKSNIQESNPYELLTRIFNDLPGDYDAFKPFLAVISEAADNTQIDLWLSLITYKAMIDLFDDTGSIHKDLYHIINAKQIGKGAGLLDIMIAQHGESAIYALLLSAYLIMPYEKALLKLASTNTARYGEAFATTLDPALNPVYQCSSAMNALVNNITSIDRDYIEAIKNVLIMATRDETIHAPNFIDLIKQYVDEPKSVAVTECKAGFFSALSSRPAWWARPSAFAHPTESPLKRFRLNPL